ncbi:MAG: ATP-binding cassette domain-containing protein [Bacteroidetes bacterium]|nr:ATP-binding cassette domain-containing protein [Bacteroidota bacterium]
MAEFHIQSIHAGEQLLVNDIRLSFKQGECLALVGESGSGKSLSALAMMNLLPNSLTSKAAFVHGEQPSVAMVFQEPMSALNPSMRVGRQVAEAAEASLGLSRKAANEKALTWFKHTQIADPEQSFKKYPHQMSGG